MKSLSAALMFVLLSSCASQGSYRRLPTKFTTLGPSSATESYLIEVVQAFGDPIARRFDFEGPEAMMSVTIRSFTPDGARPVVRKSGAEAAALIRHFRDVDWNSIDRRRSDDGSFTPDDIALFFKARTAQTYREAQGGMSDSPPLRVLFEAVMKE
jgi:hypothetical protein